MPQFAQLYRDTGWGMYDGYNDDDDMVHLDDPSTYYYGLRDDYSGAFSAAANVVLERDREMLIETMAIDPSGREWYQELLVHSLESVARDLGLFGIYTYVRADDFAFYGPRGYRKEHNSGDDLFAIKDL